ncbi:glycosyltransferase family 4 protein [Microbacterium sp. 4R-513]|uniref:glycosyltransferase n=1 Tax=Microbacterium sp. 4R-513 TaxID=2567934 RepID=UPI0013E19993|nr:glycosyltransferase [Microbacterium sp. 4R-513]QIG38541.1 glycosyltransferase family 4 protein [Microbacterium sp. 4R-513]
MRILLVTPSLGADPAARVWAAWLADRGHGVFVAAVDAGGVELPAPVGRLTLPAGRAADRALGAGVEASRPDVVLALGGEAGARAVQAAASIPVVIREDRLTGGDSRSIRNRVRRSRTIKAYRGAARVAAVSHAVAAELVSAYGVAGSRVVVVPNPVALAAPDRPAAEAPPPADTAAAAGDPLALLVPEADRTHAELVLDAAAALRAQGVDTRVVTYERRDGRAPALGARTSAVPFEARPWSDAWLAEAPPGAVVVLPASTAGFADSLVSAAASGIPSVAVSHAFGVADAVVPGRSGQLAFTATPHSLAQAVLAARGMPRPRADGWTARFSPDESGRLLLATLHRAASPHSPQNGRSRR